MYVAVMLKANIDFWRDTLKPAPWILDYISNGYKLPLESIPGSFIGKNQDSAVKNSDFVEEALSPLSHKPSILERYVQIRGYLLVSK